MIDLLRSRSWRASDLAVAVHLTPPALSRHLRVLRQCGLIEDDRVDPDGRVRLYRLRRDRLQVLSQWLDTFQTHWDDQLYAFKQYVEKSDGTS